MTYLDPKSREYTYLREVSWNKGRGIDRLEIEFNMIRKGGYVEVAGKRHGEGLGFHYKAAMSCLWPHFDWILWTHLLIDAFATEPEVAVLGPGSSTKTYCAAAFGLCMLWAWKRDTTILMSTTTRDSLDLRVWGSAVELIRKAREIRPQLPGRIRGSKHRFTLAEVNEEEDDLSDHRDGIVGIACKQGDQWVGISNYVGLKNARIVLIADEGHLMAQGFLDSIANLRNNPVFKLFTLGNPKDPMDPLGRAAEPKVEDGGWDGYTPEKKTKSWRTRNGGLAIQLCGLDSPNFKYGRGLNPYPYLITPEAIEKNVKDYGEDSLMVAMMSYGIMPRTGATKRVIDLSMCDRYRAHEDPIWAYADKIIHVVGLDAAYSGTGGDRSPLTHLAFGPDVTGRSILCSMEPQTIIPINPMLKTDPEAQLVEFTMRYCMERGIPPENVGFDSTGRGTLAAAFARLWSVNVIPIEFGGYASEDRMVSQSDRRTEHDVYFNKMSALWYASRQVIESGQLRRVPRTAVEEGQLRYWDIVKARSKFGQPLIQVEPKDKMKARIGRSPDLWDSFCAALEVARIRGFQIAGLVRVGVEARRTPQWLQERHKAFVARQRQHELVPV